MNTLAGSFKRETEAIPAPKLRKMAHEFFDAYVKTVVDGCADPELLDKAEPYIWEAYNTLSELDTSSEDKEEIASTNLLVARLFYYKEDMENAIYFAEEALKNNPKHMPSLALKEKIERGTLPFRIARDNPAPNAEEEITTEVADQKEREPQRNRLAKVKDHPPKNVVGRASGRMAIPDPKASVYAERFFDEGGRLRDAPEYDMSIEKINQFSDDFTAVFNEDVDNLVEWLPPYGPKL